MKEILTGNTHEKWQQIKTHPFYAEDLAELRAMGEKYLTDDIPTVRYTAYCRFAKDGDRREYETPYFERRRRLARLAVLVKVDGEKYLDALCDYLWAIMDEATWTAPAHQKGVPTFGDEAELDLFNTETGALLAETYHLLGELLPPIVRQRIETTVKERIIRPFFARPFWWMHGPNNWGSVCAYQVALCIFYLGTEDDFLRAEPTLHRTMELFLSSYGSDGCCLEGLTYWSYGFGSLLFYADAVRNYSREHSVVCWTEGNLPAEKRDVARNPDTGVIDYFKREDVRRAALFAVNTRLHGDTAVSFSDGRMQYSWCRSLFYVVDREYPGLVRYPAGIPSTQSPSAGSLGILRYFLWSDPCAAYDGEPNEGCVYYEDAAWFIKKTSRYSLAAKGGNNAEPHNHNDLGSFLISSDSGMMLCDLGSGEYTAAYFNESTRYGYLVNSSRGHSVPIVNGRYQEVGKQKCVCETDGEHTFSVSFGFAYGDPTVKSITRTFDCDGGGVTVTDRFVFAENPTSLIERFVSTVEPRLGDGEITVGDARLLFDGDRLSVSIQKEAYSASLGKPAAAYLIDLTAKAPQETEEYVFRILV